MKKLILLIFFFILLFTSTGQSQHLYGKDLQLVPTSALSTTTNFLYNIGGTLYWNGSPVATGTAFLSWTDTINKIGTKYDVDSLTNSLYGLIAAGGLQWTDTLTKLATRYDLLSKLNVADSNSKLATRYWISQQGYLTSLTAGYRIGVSGSTINNTSYWKNQDTLNVSDGLVLSTSKKLSAVTNNSSDWNSNYTLTGYEGWYGFLNNAESTISFNDADSSLSLTKVSGNITYIRDGIICAVSSNQNLKITGTAGGIGVYYFYIDNTNGTLEVNTTGWTLKDTKVPVAIIKWNKTAPAGIKYKMEDERHGGSGSTYGSLWPRGLHYYVHFNIGPRWQSGGVTTGTVGGSTSTQNQLRITEAEIDDDDMSIILPVKAAPTTQVPTNWIVYQRNSATTWIWDTVAVPYPYTAGGYIQYDLNGTMTASSNSKWVNTYIAFTNIKANSNAKDSARFIIIPGRADFASLALAQAEDPSTFDFTGFNIAECVIRYRVTWNTTGVATTVLGRVKLAAQPVAILNSISATSVPTAANQWATVGNDIINTNSGNVGIGAQTPLSKLSIIGSKGTNENMLNLVQSDWNKDRSTVQQASDTSAIKLSFTDGGKPLVSMKNNAGGRVFDIDSTAKISLVKLAADSTITPGIQALGALGSTETVYLTRGNTITATRDASTTITLVGGVSGTTYTFVFTHENSATAYTVAFSPNVYFRAAANFTNTANAVDIVTIKLIGTTWYGEQAGPYSVAW